MSEEKKLHENEELCDCGCNHDGDCDCCDDEEIVELFDENGKAYKFFHIGGTQYEDKWYVCFMPAENVDGLDDESVVIFEAGEEKEDGSADLKPVENEELLNKVYEQFCNELDEQAAAYEAAQLDGCGCDDEECDCDDDHCGCGHHHTH